MAFVFVFRPGFSNSILLAIRKTRAVASSSSSTEFSLFSQELALAPRHRYCYHLLYYAKETNSQNIFVLIDLRFEANASFLLEPFSPVSNHAILTKNCVGMPL